MSADLSRWTDRLATVAERLAEMVRFAKDRFKADWRFRTACLAVPALVGVAWMFGGGGGSFGPAPAPPPIFVGGSSASSGTPPPYQMGGVQTAPAQPDPASEQRQRGFAAAVAAAVSEPQPGLRCELIKRAAGALQAVDRARPLPYAAGAFADADTCQAQLDLSDRRFAALEKAGAAFEADPTPPAATALSRAGQQVGPFDRSRDLTERRRALLDKAQAATILSQESDVRLKAFTDAETTWRGGPTLDAQTRLATAAQALTSSFDQVRLGGPQRLTYQTATELAELFAASDRRLAAAVDSAKASGPGQGADSLVPALGALTPLDRQRATPDQSKALADAQGIAQGMALTLLTRLSAELQAGPTSTTDEAAAQARRVIGPVDPASLSADQRQALALADQATGRIRASDTRADAAQSAVENWRRATSPQAARQVIDSYRAVSDYDRQRHSASQEAIYGQLEGAYFVAAGKEIGLSRATRSQVPVFVVVRDSQGGPPGALREAAVSTLAGLGYRLADGRAGAALVLELSAALEAQQQVQVGTRTIQTALANTTLRAVWSVDGSEFDRELAKTNGPGMSDQQAVAASFEQAGKVLAERFNGFVETGRKP